MMIVTEGEYKMCYVIDLLETLKRMGITGGGYDVNHAKMEELLRQGKTAGFKAPTEDEISDCMASIREDFKRKQENDDS